MLDLFFTCSSEDRLYRNFLVKSTLLITLLIPVTLVFMYEVKYQRDYNLEKCIAIMGATANKVANINLMVVVFYTWLIMVIGRFVEFSVHAMNIFTCLYIFSVGFCVSLVFSSVSMFFLMMTVSAFCAHCTSFQEDENRRDLIPTRRRRMKL